MGEVIVAGRPPSPRYRPARAGHDGGAGRVRVAVRVRPGARAAAVGGRWDGPRGPALLVAVPARAVEGAANTAVVAAVAAAFGVRRDAVGIVGGARGRDKVVEIAGEEPALRAVLESLLAGG